VPDTNVKQQLRIACLETMRLFENIKVSSDSRIIGMRLESKINELNGILNQLENELTVDVLKTLAIRINQMHQQVIDDTNPK
jgi:hypothetical protein